MTVRRIISLFLFVGLAFLASTGLYLAAFSGLRAPYLFVVLLHAGLGLVLIPGLLLFLPHHLRQVRTHPWRSSGMVTGAATGLPALACAGFGVSLIITGATRPHLLELWAHQIGGWGLVMGLLLHLMLLPAEKRGAVFGAGPVRWAMISGAALFVLIGAVDLMVSRADRDGVAHADAPPADFSPSLAATASGGLIPSGAFLDAGACERCHADAYHQWRGSAHHFASFNNPFYRKSVEYTAERVGYAPTKFCGACHDPLLLFSGRMDGPIDASRPEARAGITCQVCHGITKIRDVRGNGSYTIAPPGQYPFAGSRSSLLLDVHDLMVRLKPGPHRDAMLKPFHRSPEFCSVCHKVHIPEAVNHFKWTRGQDEYDHWHHSGVSGNAVMSWTPPNPSPKICRDCHMPAVASGDFGGKRRSIEGQGAGGKGQGEARPYTIRDHRFLAANTALPTINGNHEQLDATEKFLQDKKLAVNVIALYSSPSSLHAPPVPPDVPCLLPLASCFVSPGRTVDVHVLVRNLGVGHTFPGGTNDSNEAWLEVTARDARGRAFYHSGAVEEKGDVDPSAHFYKAVLLDRSAQLIDKRNVHDWVSTLYARTIPPGGSDVARYRLTIPLDAGDHISVEATLHYRKFMDSFAKFVFAGQRAPGQTARVDQYVDESRWTMTDAPVPALPIVDVAEGRAIIPMKGQGSGVKGQGSDHLPLTPNASRLTALPDVAVKLLNSYGIGLLLQQDTKNAWAVFAAVTADAPQFIEGHINLARTQLADGDLDDAERAVQRTLKLAPDYPKALYLMGTILRQRGDYDGALTLLRRVEARYPKDRVLCNDIAQLYYLEGRYQEAIAELQRGLTIITSCSVIARWGIRRTPGRRRRATFGTSPMNR